MHREFFVSRLLRILMPILRRVYLLVPGPCYRVESRRGSRLRTPLVTLAGASLVRGNVRHRKSPDHASVHAFGLVDLAANGCGACNGR